MLTALCWIPKGAAKANPTTAEPTEEELAAMRAELEAQAAEEGSEEEDEQSESDEMEDSSGEGEDAQDAVAKAKAAAAAITANKTAASAIAAGDPSHASGIESAMRELDMDNYDNTDEEDNIMARVLGGRGAEAALDEDGDPYITMADDDSEIEDNVIKPTDLLILATRNEDDVSNLEVWVYEQADDNGEANVFVHHDILVPAFPLCVAWLDCNPNGAQEKGNYAAIGTLEPGIEFWDLDVIDAVEPVMCLGGEPKSEDASTSEGSTKKKKKKKRALAPGSHEDSVLSLCWNREFRNVLASGSADKTVKVWDIVKGTCEHTLRHHTGKVQSVVFNPVEAPVLLTGAYDQQACLVDLRNPGGDALRWQVSADVEAMIWQPQQPTCFLVSSEDGIVAAYDARKGAGSAPMFCLSAHDKPTCSLSICPTAPGLLATVSTDKKAKLWDISNNTPSLICSQDLNSGALFAVGFCPEAPHLLAAGGAGEGVVVWDVRSNAAVAARFPQLIQQ